MIVCSNDIFRSRYWQELKAQTEPRPINQRIRSECGLNPEHCHSLIQQRKLLERQNRQLPKHHISQWTRSELDIIVL
jgi:hypothetical protein